MIEFEKKVGRGGVKKLKEESKNKYSGEVWEKWKDVCLPVGPFSRYFILLHIRCVTSGVTLDANVPPARSIHARIFSGARCGPKSPVMAMVRVWKGCVMVFFPFLLRWMLKGGGGGARVQDS